MREAVIKRGYWCEEHEFFEEVLELNKNHVCGSCGCNVDHHTAVKIVMSEPGNE